MILLWIIGGFAAMCALGVAVGRVLRKRRQSDDAWWDTALDKLDPERKGHP